MSKYNTEQLELLDKVKNMSLEDMKNYIEEKAPAKKEEFKKAVLELEKYNHMKVQKIFREVVLADELPKATKKAKKSDSLKDW